MQASRRSSFFKLFFPIYLALFDLLFHSDIKTSTYVLHTIIFHGGVVWRLPCFGAALT
jgi:hypothetical protein